MSRRSAIRLLLLVGAAAVLWLLLGSLEYHWDWRVVWTYRALYAQGMAYTVLISVGAMALGLVLGVAGGLARVWPNAWLNEIGSLYVDLFRGTPLLVQIYIFYFCVAVVAHVDNPFVIGMVALACFAGAYITEMVRAGIESVDRGQWEAALATGLSYRQAMAYVVFPQAFRRIIPPIAGQFVSLVKDSSLLSVISVRELTKASEVINATTYKTFEAYLPLAVFYLLLTYPLSKLTQRLEARIGREPAARHDNTGNPGLRQPPGLHRRGPWPR